MILLNRQLQCFSEIKFRINSILNSLVWYYFLFMVSRVVYIGLKFYIEYTIQNLPLFIAL